MRTCATDADRVELANHLLTGALQIPARDEGRIEKLLNVANGGRCKSNDMARSLAMSNRSFSRLWNEIVGIQPRHFIQLMRFHNALSMIESGMELAAVAAECGYSDQAHMARRIKAISGLPPSKLRRRIGDDTYRSLYASRPGAPWHSQVNPLATQQSRS
jgi:AraC-like DNA-binding protein